MTKCCRSIFALFAAWTALGLSACGSSDSSGSASGSGNATPMSPAALSDYAGGMPDACDVLTPYIAKKHLGAAAVLSRKYRPNPHMTQCQWKARRGAITILVGDWSMVKVMGSQAKPVAGIGDEASIGPSGLVARKGGRGLYVAATVEAANEKKLASELLKKM